MDNTLELEPLSTLFKLALLYYKPEGTKISIYDNTIYLQEPSMYQGVVRYLYNDKRSDLNILEKPIKIGLAWISVNLIDIKNDVNYILKKSIAGLLRLSRSYEQDIVTYNIILSLSQLIQNYVYDNIVSDNICDYNIKNIWNDYNEIRNIKNTLADIENDQNNNRIINLNKTYETFNTSLLSIDNLLKRKDVLFISKSNINIAIKSCSNP